MTKKPATPASPFAKLEAMRDQLPAGAPPPAPAAPPAPKGPARAPRVMDSPRAAPPRAVIRMERKQRRGKEVTVVEKLALSPTELERWCKELKQALGCGGTVEGDTIVLQGDARQRLPAILTARGVGKVSVSG